MAIINQYRAVYPIENSFECDSYYVNASSMEKAINMLSTQYGKEPRHISLTKENVLTEITSETTVNFEIKSYYIDSETQEEIEIPSCIAYPTIVENAVRGNTIYCYSPSEYNIEEEIEGEITTVHYTFSKWINGNIESTDNPFIVAIPLDESITSMIIKAIYTRNVE